MDVFSSVWFRMDVVLCPGFLLVQNLDYLSDLVGRVHRHGSLQNEIGVKFVETAQSIIQQMLAEELSVFAASIYR